MDRIAEPQAPESSRSFEHGSYGIVSARLASQKVGYSSTKHTSPFSCLALLCLQYFFLWHPRLLKSCWVLPIMNASLSSGHDLSLIPLAPPPPGILSDFRKPTISAQAIIVVSAFTTVLAALSVVARLYPSLRITRCLVYDDGSCVVAFVFSTAYNGLAIATRH